MLEGRKEKGSAPQIHKMLTCQCMLINAHVSVCLLPKSSASSSLSSCPRYYNRVPLGMKR